MLAQKHPQEALAEAQKEPADWASLQVEALAYHDLGNRKASDAALKELISKYGGDSAVQIAEVYAYRGETNKALDWLYRAYEQHDAGLVAAEFSPFLKSLRGNPRFTELLNKIRPAH